MTTVPASRGFRDFRVVAKERESSSISSFLLEPVHPEGWREFHPGQYLVFRIPQSDGTGHVLRNYSVSSSPAEKGRYRITVKREGPPSPGLQHGIGSGHLHDAVKVGDVLSAEGPRGAFVLDCDSERPVVLLSGGVGLTPMVSMLHSLATTTRETHFIHACDSGDVHALRGEVMAAASARPGISVHFCYRFPSETDRASAAHHSEGVVSRDLLRKLLPLDDYDFYMCGPPVFMQAVYASLRSLGVPRERVAYEFFGPATLLQDEGGQAESKHSEAMVSPVAATAAGACVVEFEKSGIVANWNEADGSLLDLAEKQGLYPEFSCRAGICGTCKSRIRSGEIEYFEEPLDELGPGEVLLCCAKPKGPVVLDL